MKQRNKQLKSTIDHAADKAVASIEKSKIAVETTTAKATEQTRGVATKVDDKLHGLVSNVGSAIKRYRERVKLTLGKGPSKERS